MRQEGPTCASGHFVCPMSGIPQPGPRPAPAWMQPHAQGSACHRPACKWISSLQIFESSPGWCILSAASTVPSWPLQRSTSCGDRDQKYPQLCLFDVLSVPTCTFPEWPFTSGAAAGHGASCGARVTLCTPTTSGCRSRCWRGDAATAITLLPEGAERWSRPAPSAAACDRDQQCGGGMCCAVSLWIRSLRMCTPMGNLGEECHPLSHRVPFPGRRMHHTCPCLPSLACARTSPSKFRCLPDFRKEDVFF
ncbi:prokineticin-2 isoform X3 [Cygnus olor]|uniref:prokineticin-2 isoform X3 n=1 Tax=Cygnus olor TaxID=8869 RepID=UPI001ADEA066|nr:prokineticin-2 isoform X3 [Cygnus olor]